MAVQGGFDVRGHERRDSARCDGVLGGVDLAVVATLEEAGQVSWAAAVLAVFGMASVVGGLVYGAQSSRPRPTWMLLGLLAPTLSTVADAVSRLAPPSVRGEATALQSAAQSTGFALGSPVVGWVIDVSAPPGGFAAAGLAGMAAALAGFLLSRRSPARSRTIR